MKEVLSFVKKRGRNSEDREGHLEKKKKKKKEPSWGKKMETSRRDKGVLGLMLGQVYARFFLKKKE